MSQRDSGYARKERDLYETPEWVTEALLPHLPRLPKTIWEPACGSGQMLPILERCNFAVWASDIEPRGKGTTLDFLSGENLFANEPWAEFGIITNPPYELATEFCETALRRTESGRGLVSMLLRTDFDHAKSRAYLFRDNPAFAKKVVLTRRIAWFVEANGKPKASPSFNHAWYIWDWKHEGPPTIGYGP